MDLNLIKPVYNILLCLLFSCIVFHVFLNSIFFSLIILFNDFTVFLLFVLAILNSSNAIAISGAVEEFVIVMVEFPLIANDPVAFILNLYGFTVCICFVPLLYNDF